MESMNGFDRSIEELLHFADTLKFREKEIEQQHSLEIGSLKADYEIQIQIEKRRAEQLQEINRSLTEQIERSAQKQVDIEHKHTVLLTKYNCCMEENKQLRDLYKEKIGRIEELEKISRILSNEKMKLDSDVKQLKLDNQNLEERLKLIPEPSRTTTAPIHNEHVPQEIAQLVSKAVEENNELSKKLSERNNEVQKLNEQLQRNQAEDSQAMERRLLQLVAKLKNDFRSMYENQSNFFLQKIDLLKQEQRENIAKLYKH